MFGLALGGCGQHQVASVVSASWVIIDGTSPDPAKAPTRRCEDAGVLTVRIDLGSRGLFDFPCTAYQGETLSVSSGYYDIRVIAFGRGGTVLSSMEFPKLYVYGATRLGDLRLPVR